MLKRKKKVKAPKQLLRELVLTPEEMAVYRRLNLEATGVRVSISVEEEKHMEQKNLLFAELAKKKANINAELRKARKKYKFSQDVKRFDYQQNKLIF